MRTALFAVALALIIGACAPIGVPSQPAPIDASPIEDATDPPAPSDALRATVEYVQDGDSIRVTIDGVDHRVRLIGINTPEREECFGTEARDMLDQLVSGKSVRVSTDVEAFDQYGRILGYVWADDTFINAELVRAGAALARSYEPNVTLQAHLDAAEVTAQNNQSGMWSPTACGQSAVSWVVIVAVNADAPGRDNENRNGEWIAIENQGDEVTDLTGWTIKDESSVHRFRFETGVSISPGERITIYTGCGDDDLTELYWCDDTPVWDNAGDTAFLVDATGSMVDQLGY